MKGVGSSWWAKNDEALVNPDLLRPEQVEAGRRPVRTRGEGSEGGRHLLMSRGEGGSKGGSVRSAYPRRRSEGGMAATPGAGAGAVACCSRACSGGAKSASALGDWDGRAASFVDLFFFLAGNRQNSKLAR